MIELPEAATIAAQLTKELEGAKVISCMRGNSPHKFAFYNHSPEEYEKLTVGKKVGKSGFTGSCVTTEIGKDLFLALGEGGEKISLHNDGKSIPKKHQLLLGFDDGRFLSVTVSGWGMASLFTHDEMEKHRWIGKRVFAIKDGKIDKDLFLEYVSKYGPTEKTSLKYFIISDPGINGVANGYLQDILFNARLHPKRPVGTLGKDEAENLYNAICGTISDAFSKGGRDTEFDIYGNPGGYPKILDSRSAGNPCPTCGTTIEKIQYLGGACYFCPKCQK